MCLLCIPNDCRSSLIVRLHLAKQGLQLAGSRHPHLVPRLDLVVYMHAV